jgi:hypothetical protein
LDYKKTCGPASSELNTLIPSPIGGKPTSRSRSAACVDVAPTKKKICDPSSRDLQRETRSREDDRQTLGTFASFRRVDRTQPFSGRVCKHFLSPSVVTVVVTVVVVFLIRVRVRRRRSTCIARGQRTGKSSHRHRRPRPGCRSRTALRTTNKNVISSDGRSRYNRWDTTRRFSGGVDAAMHASSYGTRQSHSSRNTVSETNRQR